jgi:hypothetical protein
VGSALSTAPSTEAAVDQIITELDQRLGRPVDLLMVFATVEPGSGHRGVTLSGGLR